MSCKKCKAGQFSTALASRCVDCAAGRESSAASATCSKCAAGKYSMSPSPDGIIDYGVDQCLKCPDGQHSNTTEAARCMVCGLGDRGEFSNGAGKSSCVMCDLGRFQPENGATPGFCTDCPIGFYQDGKGARDCKPCPEDTFGEKPRSSSLGECRACSTHAEHTTTSGLTGVSNATLGCICSGAKVNSAEANDQRGYYRRGPIGSKGRQLCSVCPTGASCEQHGLDLLTIHAQTGFWRPNRTSTIFGNCERAFQGIDAKEQAHSRCCPKGHGPANDSSIVNDSATPLMRI